MDSPVNQIMLSEIAGQRLATRASLTAPRPTTRLNSGQRLPRNRFCGAAPKKPLQLKTLVSFRSENGMCDVAVRSDTMSSDRGCRRGRGSR